MLPVLALASAAVMSACGHAAGKSSAAPPNHLAGVAAISGHEQERVAGEYLITLSPGTDTRVIADVYGRFGVRSIKAVGADIFQLNLADDPGPEKMEDLGRQEARIRAVQPNFIYRANLPAGKAK